MSSVLFVGNADKNQFFLDNYIADNKILPYEIDTYDQRLTISEARLIKRTLSFVITGNKAFVLKNEITVEAQNALLKCMEESKENIHFLICCENENTLLPTILSRSKIVKLNDLVDAEDSSIGDVILRICSGVPSYSDIDTLSLLCEKKLEKIIPIFRKIVLDSEVDIQTKINTHLYCKRLLMLLPLTKVNNVNEKIVLDKIFWG